MVVGVFAEVPLPGRCLTGLLSAHGPEWVAGLYAAMLRDTLDGLLSVDAHRWVVLAPDADHAVLARHAPAPWDIVTAPDLPAAREVLGASFVLARSDAPTAPVDPIVDALGAALALGATPTGEAWTLVANGIDLGNLAWSGPEASAMVRLTASRASVALVELPTWPIITTPSAVLDLIEELRRHPDRAPRTAHYLVTAS